MQWPQGDNESLAEMTENQLSHAMVHDNSYNNKTIQHITCLTFCQLLITCLRLFRNRLYHTHILWMSILHTVYYTQRTTCIVFNFSHRSEFTLFARHSSSRRKWRHWLSSQFCRSCSEHSLSHMHITVPLYVIRFIHISRNSDNVVSRKLRTW